MPLQLLLNVRDVNILQEGEFAESCCGADLRHGVFRGDGNSSRMRLLLSWLNACTCCPSLTNKIIQRDAAVSNSVAVGCAIIENRAEHLVTQSKIKAKNKKKNHQLCNRKNKDNPQHG